MTAGATPCGTARSRGARRRRPREVRPLLPTPERRHQVDGRSARNSRSRSRTGSRRRMATRRSAVASARESSRDSTNGSAFAARPAAPRPGPTAPRGQEGNNDQDGSKDIDPRLLSARVEAEICQSPGHGNRGTCPGGAGPFATPPRRGRVVPWLSIRTWIPLTTKPSVLLGRLRGIGFRGSDSRKDRAIPGTQPGLSFRP
jgi:hypothetical protein